MFLAETRPHRALSHPKYLENHEKEEIRLQGSCEDGIWELYYYSLHRILGRKHNFTSTLMPKLFRT